MIRSALPADVPAVARVHVESWRTTYGGMVPDDFLAHLTLESREEQWRGLFTNPETRSRLWVAEDVNRQIVGFACVGPEQEGNTPYTGELYAIYLLKAAQGAGLGRALTSAAAGWLLESGYTGMLVWVLRENPARRF